MFDKDPTGSQGWLIENGSGSIINNYPNSKINNDANYYQ